MQAKLKLCGIHMTTVPTDEAVLLYEMQQRGLIVDVIEECCDHPGMYIVGIGPNQIVTLPKKHLDFLQRPSTANPTYIETQLFQVAPLPILEGNNGQVRIKLISPQGKTNWLNITPEQHVEIEKILVSSLDN